jgi:hypothetical protein
MKKIISVPSGVEEYCIQDNEVQAVILPITVTRVNVGYSPKLELIISFSQNLTMGPKKKQLDIPVLNFCPNLKEIISFGQIEFNTMLNINGKNRDCGYSFVNEEDVLPYLTIVGKNETFENYEIPCFQYDLTKPMENVDRELLTRPIIARNCPVELVDTLITSRLENLGSNNYAPKALTPEVSEKEEEKGNSEIIAFPKSKVC